MLRAHSHALCALLQRHASVVRTLSGHSVLYAGSAVMVHTQLYYYVCLVKQAISAVCTGLCVHSTSVW